MKHFIGVGDEIDRGTIESRENGVKYESNLPQGSTTFGIS